MNQLIDPLKPVSNKTLLAFKAIQPLVIQTAVEHSMQQYQQRSPNIDNRRKQLSSGMEFTCKTLTSVMRVGDHMLLLDQIDWAIDRTAYDYLDRHFIAHQISILKKVYQQALTDSQYSEVFPYFNLMLQFLHNNDLWAKHLFRSSLHDRINEPIWRIVIIRQRLSIFCYHCHGILGKSQKVTWDKSSAWCDLP